MGVLLRPARRIRAAYSLAFVSDRANRPASPAILKYAAFTNRPEGGNRAGVVIDAKGLSESDMQEIAIRVGYSETAFLVAVGTRTFDVRYFSPEMEVPFCGHATIASAVALAERIGAGQLLFHTAAGTISIDTVRRGPVFRATLTSPPPRIDDVSANDVHRVLEALHWAGKDLDPRLPARISDAGARHLILAAGTRRRLAVLDYDFAVLKAVMHELALITVNLVWRQDETTFYARNPFPVGGVVEDPATGAAAAALGGYLRELKLASPSARITVHQGGDVGRPSTLIIDLEPETPGIRVTGEAVGFEFD
jgi:PhzF family phenazine biosynthesis protein